MPSDSGRTRWTEEEWRMRAKRILGIMFVTLFLIGLLGACNNQQASDGTSVSEVEDNTTSEIVQEEEADMNTISGDHPIPQELENIPEEYYQAADQQGELVELTYNTYESTTYEQKSKELTKRAIVYLPNGYSEEKKYNVLYLMHGGWSNETTTLGTPDNPNSFKNVIDHAIDNEEVEPLIIVCPTYNNESPEDSGDYTLAFYTLTVNYHNELINDLIPAVEGTYSTYAESTSSEDIKNSRDHRAFGGFSMGSVTTWYTLVNSLDEFRYFLPMSGAMDYEGDDVDAAVTASGHSPDDFFIYAMTGTDDFEYGNFTRQIEGMLGMPSGNFILTDNEESGNIALRIKDGYSHNGLAAREYTYNGLMWFWN